MKTWHSRYYKLLLLVPLALALLSAIVLINFYKQTNSFIRKDITLTGGTSITVYNVTDIKKLSSWLRKRVEDFSLREISDLRTGKQIAFVVEANMDAEKLKALLEEYLGYVLDDENSSIEFTGSALSESFYKQLRIALIIAFLLMASVVFIIFRSPAPSLAVVLSAMLDMLMTLAAVNLLGMKISTAGIVAFLMLIGYSVDTDILLTTRVLREKHGSIDTRLLSAFKTGITMTLTSIAAIIVALLITSHFSNVLRQIFTVLALGLSFDLINTWLTNAGLLRWYCERHKLD